MISRSDVYAAIGEQLTLAEHPDALLQELLPAKSRAKGHLQFLSGYVDASVTLESNQTQDLMALLDIAVLAVRCLEYHGLPDRSKSRLLDVIDEEGNDDAD